MAIQQMNEENKMFVFIHFIFISASLVYNYLSQREALKNLSFKGQSISSVLAEHHDKKLETPHSGVIEQNTSVA